jgi:hypothetical protein
VSDARVGERLSEVARSKARPVVCQHALHDDAVLGEELQRSTDERARRFLALVRPDLRIGQAGSIIDGRMNEVVAVATVTPRTRRVWSTMNPPPAARGDPALLLHVHVHELARACSLVAHPRSRRSIQIAQPRRTHSPQDPVDGCWRFSECPGDPVRPLQGLHPTMQDGPLPAGAQARRRAVRSARPIDQTRAPFGPEPSQPLVAGRRRAPLCLGRHGHAPAHLEHTRDEQQPSLGRQLGPSMCHESLLAVWLDPDEQGGSHLLNNVLRNYS